MSNTSIVVPFAPDDILNLSSLTTEWVALEQADIPNSASEAKMSDIFSMIGYAKAGMTSLDYIHENCSSISVKGGSIFIKLDFYVWLSSLDLPYAFQVNDTSISIGPATKYSKPTSFDVIFENKQSVDLGRIFDGTLHAEMPFFNSDGTRIIPSPDIEIIGSNAVLSEKATTVLRADGIAEGYKHTVTMELVKDTGVSITDININILVYWGDCDPDDAACITKNSDTLKMEIPACVSELLSSCAVDGSLLSSTLEETVVQGEATGKQVVYYSTCSGQILKQYWKANDE